MSRPYDSKVYSDLVEHNLNTPVHPVWEQRDAFGRRKPKLGPVSLGLLAAAAVAAVVLMVLGM